ncbi:hypothetical protein [Nocardia sp. NPDC005366]|uniref:hypothetical protein n=1 Tax=Nocardia sp. NPDC005366 TaxID=3156878 RepID=UPI0033B80E38
MRDLDEVDAEWRTWEKPWPDWRDGDQEDLQRHLDWPVDDAIWQVEREGQWLRGVPRLVPVYGHRFLPAGCGSWGHPVLSVWRLGDIICYGGDLNL